MLYKLIENHLVPVPQTYTHNGVTVSNYDALPEETHLSHGWKPLTESPRPEDTETVYYTPLYNDGGNSITVQWVGNEITPEEPPADIQSEVDELRRLMGALLGVEEAVT